MKHKRDSSLVPLLTQVTEFLDSEHLLETGPAPVEPQLEEVKTQTSKKVVNFSSIETDVELRKEDSRVSLDSEHYRRQIERWVTPTPPPQPKTEFDFMGTAGKQKFWEVWCKPNTFKERGQDVREIYLRECKKQNLLPHPSHIVQDSHPASFKLSGVGLTPNYVVVITATVSAMPFPLEKIDLSSNSLTSFSGTKILEALKGYSASLKTVNFANNKLGPDWVEKLVDLFKVCKSIKTLNVSGNYIGDQAASNLVNGLILQDQLKNLRLSNCGLNQSPVGRVLAESLKNLFKTHRNLKVVDLSWNHLQGEAAGTVVKGLKKSRSIESVNFKNNLLGKGNPPACDQFNKLFAVNNKIKTLNLSNNFIEHRSAIMLAYYLTKSQSLEELKIEGNPIGDSGVQKLLQSLEEVKLDLSMDQAMESFQSNSPEPSYEFDLSSELERTYLYRKLDLAYSGKLKIENLTVDGREVKVPESPNENGIWDLPGSGLAKLEVWGEESSQKVMDNLVFGSYCNVFQKNAKKPEIKLQLVKAICDRYYMWGYQAQKFLSYFKKGSAEQEIAATFIVPRIKGLKSIEATLKTLTDTFVKNILDRTGSVFGFSEKNPNGRYSLDLGNRLHREVLERLFKLNKSWKPIEELSAFRNVVYGGLKIDNLETWKVPQQGVLELDFSMITALSSELSSQKVVDSVKHFLKNSTASVKTKLVVLKLVAPELTFTTESLCDFVQEVSLDSTWVEEALVSCASRCKDYQQLHYFKKFLKSIEQSHIAESLTKRLGVLKVFSPHDTEGIYKLDLSEFEDREIAKILLKIGLEEGLGEGSLLTLDSEPSEITQEVIDNLPCQGNLNIVFFTIQRQEELRNNFLETLKSYY